MMKESDLNGTTKQVHFANGFPPKGLVNTVHSNDGHQPNKFPGRRYVSLDEVSPRLGHLHRTIPPLAKGRGQFCSIRDRPGDDRYRRRPDPFQAHKGAEKTGFSASPIRHAKPRMAIRACRSSEPPSPPPPTAAVYNLRTLARRSVYSTTSSRSAENGLEEDTAIELKSRNNRIFSDVEKESIQTELAGLEEVYHRICNGKVESLYSLLYPSRRDAKRGPVQYIKTSAPVSLRSPRANPQFMKHTKEKNIDVRSSETNGSDTKTSEGKGADCLAMSDAGFQGINENTSRPILIPLPFIRSDVGFVTPAKQQKPMYAVPLVYSNRTGKPATGHVTFAAAAPAVINFNPADIPELACPGNKNGLPTGSIVGVQNKTNTGTVAVVADTTTSHSSSPSPKGTTPTHTPVQSQVMADLEKGSTADYVSDQLSGKVELESVVSECMDAGASGDGTAFLENPDNEESQEWKTGVQEDNSIDAITEQIVAQGIRLSITTEDGKIGGPEIFDYDKRDIQSEQLAAKHIEEMEEIGEKKMKEFEELLEEHQQIIDEVNELEKEIKNSHHDDASN